MKKNCLALLAGGLSAILLPLFLGGCAEPAKPEGKVLVTTFPIYQFTRNVAQGRDGLKLKLMLPANLGCPHDYAPTPQDLNLLGQAELLVKNGLDMEAFLDRAIARVNPELKVVDTSSGIAALPATGFHDHGHGHNHDHGHGHGHDHHHGDFNPHLFASPRHAAEIVANIADALAEFDPAGARLYRANAAEYSERLHALADEFEQLGSALSHRKIVVQHDVFDYFAAAMGLDIVALVHPHPGQEPSAHEAMRIIEAIRQEGAVALFVEPQYSDRTARMIAAEAGIRIAALDPVANGPVDAPLDYYEQTMRKNLRIIRETLAAEPAE